MKRWKRVLSVALVFVMVLGLSACKEKGNGSSGSNGGNGGNKGNAAVNSLAKEYVFSLKEFDLEDIREGADECWVQSSTRVGDRIYMMVQLYNWSSMDGNSSRLVTMKTDGSDIRNVVLELYMEGDERTGAAAKKPEEPEESEDLAWQVYENTDISNYQIAPDGTIYGIKRYVFNDYSDQDNIVNENKQYVCAWEESGKMRWETPLENLQTEDSWSYVNSVIVDKDGNVTLFISGDKNGRMEVSPEGEVSPFKALSDHENIFDRVGSVIPQPDGTLMITYYNENWDKMYFANYDISTDEMSEGTELPSSLAWSGMSGATFSDDGTLYYCDSEGVFKFHRGDAEPAQVMSYINSDLATTNFNALVILDEDHFIGFYEDTDFETYGSKMAGGLFTRVNPEDIPDKEVLVLGGSYIPYRMRGRVLNFNKTSNTHRIVIKDYSTYNTYDDYNASYTQLNNDIISGNMPDILIADTYGMNLENYVSKGLLADVGELMKKDPEISGMDYMENVFDACKINGKLYEVIPSFSVQTYVAKKSIVGDRETFSMKDAEEMLERMPEGAQIFGDTYRDYFIPSVMEFRGSDFVDVSTGKCNFNSQDFIELLEFAKTLPQNENMMWDSGDSDDYWEDYWSQYQSQYRENRTLLARCYISRIADINQTINGAFGEDVSFVGFPGQGGNGSVIGTGTTYVLSAKSKKLDAAWEFVRYYLTEEYQETLEWELPVLKKTFDANAQKALQKPYYVDEDGNKVEYDETYYMNNEEIVLPTMTQEQIDAVVNFISGVKKRSYSNQDVTVIINEEIDAFYQDQKSAQDVAGIIQNRVQLFVNENR